MSSVLFLLNKNTALNQSCLSAMRLNRTDCLILFSSPNYQTLKLKTGTSSAVHCMSTNCFLTVTPTFLLFPRSLTFTFPTSCINVRDSQRTQKTNMLISGTSLAGQMLKSNAKSRNHSEACKRKRKRSLCGRGFHWKLACRRILESRHREITTRIHSHVRWMTNLVEVTTALTFSGDRTDLH
jgi:hypothetical protein